MVAVVLSLIAIIFAAIAAYAAMRTVQLTRAMQIEARAVRLGEALASVMTAANEAQPSPGHPVLRTKRLDDALFELYSCVTTAVAGMPEAVTKPIDTILNDKDAAVHPTETMLVSRRALLALRAETDPHVDPSPLLFRLPGRDNAYVSAVAALAQRRWRIATRADDNE